MIFCASVLVAYPLIVHYIAHLSKPHKASLHIPGDIVFNRPTRRPTRLVLFRAERERERERELAKTISYRDTYNAEEDSILTAATAVRIFLPSINENSANGNLNGFIASRVARSSERASERLSGRARLIMPSSDE